MNKKELEKILADRNIKIDISSIPEDASISDYEIGVDEEGEPKINATYSVPYPLK